MLKSNKPKDSYYKTLTKKNLETLTILLLFFVLFLINFDHVLILYRIESWLQVEFFAFKFETHTPTVFFKVWFLLSFVFSKKKK